MIRKAVVSDVEKVHKIINYFASKDLMLPRSLREIYENIRDYFVYIDGGEIIGCAALHIFWKDLSEIKSLAVQETHQRKGIGGELVRECIQEAKSLGIERLFVLTYQPEFFQRRGFRLVEKESLPHKIWTECIRCPKFPDCNEVPLILDIPTASAFQE
ncbi:MAG: N-acetyltransferase [Candidatus Brocadiales bacterium]|nr:N-acetyltransferase [Candidatus Brocadiales bacterium]